jgi:hypothetical protein
MTYANGSQWHYVYDEAILWRTTSDCALRLGNPELAQEAVSKSLAASNPDDMHNAAFRTLFKAEAFL